MKTMELRQWGLKNLRPTEAEKPQAGAGEVLVRLTAVSLNYRDYQIVTGEFAPGQPLPIIPCSDGAGVVESVGAGVTALAPGDHVATLFFPNWIRGEALGAERSVSAGLEATGALREFGLYREQAVAKIAAHLSDAEASCLPCAGLTAWNCLTTFSRIQSGDLVLIQGTGGVAILALLFAKAMGAQVIITSSSHQRLTLARSLGADHGINYRETPQWGAAAKEITGGRGVDAVIEIGGEGTLPQSIASIRRGGHINIIGYLAGYGLNLSVIDLIERNAHLHGLSVGNREQFEAMMAFVAQHEIRPVISATYGLLEASQALQAVAAGGHFGKLVVKIS